MIKVSARLFPIGFIISVDAPNFDPHDFYVDGNWERIKGRVIVGVDEAQTEFNVTGKTGGAKTHTLTINEMPAHQHDVVIDQPGRDDGLSFYSLKYNPVASKYVDPNATRPRGGGQPHNNLPPYQTAYMWKLISYSN